MYLAADAPGGDTKSAATFSCTTHLLDLGLPPLIGWLEAGEELAPGPRLVETKLLEVLTQLGELLNDGIHLELDNDEHGQPCESWLPKEMSDVFI